MPATPTDQRVTVLLVDDQALVGETVRRSLAGESDITFHFCKDPNQAIATADAVHPTVILQDLVMPDIEGLELVRRYRAHGPTAEVPIVVLSTREEPVTKAEAFALGANDYIVKLPDRLELLARIRHHSRGYINQLQRDEAYRALEASQKALASDVESAAKYVRSLLPRKITKGAVRADWRFIPSAALGGDTFGYHMLDDRRFAFYLIDVVGHGVGAALLSVSVLNAIRSQSLPDTDFAAPEQVLTALNRRFEMSQQGDKYFTAWYGVYDVSSRRLDYSGGGHPPALLVRESADVAERVSLLKAGGPMVGAFDDITFDVEHCEVPSGSRLYLYSDGVFEITRTDGTMWPFEDYVQRMALPVEPDRPTMDRIIAEISEISGKEGYDDDFSIIELTFDANP
jgi:sigma-B regulation protein RsbU (phosphoserine phosphatase)